MNKLTLKDENGNKIRLVDCGNEWRAYFRKSPDIFSSKTWLPYKQRFTTRQKAINFALKKMEDGR